MVELVHRESHFLSSETVRDVVIGMSDGLTVPFALAAGLSGAVSSTGLVVTAGLAEIAAGAIAMGLGGFLAARTEAEHYASEERREYLETIEVPEIERSEVAEIFRDYGLGGDDLDRVVAAISRDRRRWVEFMMRHELGLERPDPRRALASALTIGGAYLAGGLIPLVPYMVIASVTPALLVSVVVTLFALLIFGAVKGRLTGVDPIKAGLQTLTVGGLAAAAAFLVARAVSG